MSGWPPAGHNRQRELFGAPTSACRRCSGGNGDLCEACEAELAADAEAAEEAADGPEWVAAREAAKRAEEHEDR